MGATDAELLQRYARHQDEDAFAQIVQRHIHWVYSAAARQVRTSALAEEVAQAAFLELARAARRLRSDTLVSGWLYQVTRRRAIDLLRRETSRRQREQAAAEIFAMSSPAPEWTQIEPWLDDAVSALDEADRAAVLLRYFEGKSLREVGEAIGASENAAQKRVTRALESLRELLVRRGVNVGSGGLGLALASHAVGTAPPALAATVLSAVGAAAVGALATSAVPALQLSAMTILKKSLVAGTLVALTGAALYQHRQATTLREQLADLRRNVAIAEPGAAAGGHRAGPAPELADELERSQAEVLRLRGEVARLLRERTQTARAETPDAARVGSDDTAYSEITAATIEAGLERLIAAARRNDPKNVASFLAWRQGEGVPPEGLESVRAAMTANTVGTFRDEENGVARLRVVNQREQEPGQVRARVEAVSSDGRRIEREIEFSREGDEWKPVLSIERSPAGSYGARLFLPLTPELGPVHP